MVAINKLHKFLAEKEKAIKETAENGGGNNYEKKEFLPFFNPNKMFGNRDEVIVRVLPNKESFYQEYKKHMFTIGTFKQSVCFNSIGADGEKLGEHCPFCDFLKEHKEELDRETAWNFTPRTVYMMFVFNPYAKQIQKYETNDYGIVDITKPLVELLDSGADFDPDKEGFDIVFRKDKKYARVVEVLAPEESIEDVLKRSTNTQEIKGFFEEIMPFQPEFTMKQSNSLFEQAINAFAPSFAGKVSVSDPDTEFNYGANKKEKAKSVAKKAIDEAFGEEPEEEEEVEFTEVETIKPKKPIIPAPVEDEEEEKPKSRKVVVTDDEETTEDDGADDIKAFLAKRKLNKK